MSPPFISRRSNSITLSIAPRKTRTTRYADSKPRSRSWEFAVPLSPRPFGPFPPESEIAFSNIYEESSLLPRLTPVDKCAEPGRRDNIHRAVFVQIYSEQVRARSRMIVNEFGHKLCSSRRFGITYCLA